VLVAILLSGIVATAALSMMLSSRNLYASDRGRTDLNQNLRIGADLVGIDVREAGQRLPADFPAIEIVDGGVGPDSLVLRRNLLDAVLPLCASIVSGTPVATVQIADAGASPPPGCAPTLDGDADGWPDNVGEWRAYRDSVGGAVSIYVFGPVTGLGEFVRYDGDGGTPEFLAVSAAAPWQNSYDVDEQCRVYVVEERRFELAGDRLQLVINGDVAGAISLVDNMIDFRAGATLDDGTVRTAFGPADAWADLLSIDVVLSGEVLAERRVIRKAVAGRFFPRNVLSL
jgi:type IV pilus assembly protein PilW